jgi:hypothetical protein
MLSANWSSCLLYTLLQGRLFLSPRILGFDSNLFGMKTKFQFIWEDIHEIVETPVAINPYIVIYLRKGRGLDARNGMRGIDALGRMKFHFCSFVKPVTAFRYKSFFCYLTTNMVLAIVPTCI